MFAWVGFSIYLIFKVSIFPRSNVPTGNHQSLLAEYNIMKTKTFMMEICHEAMTMKMMMMMMMMMMTMTMAMTMMMMRMMNDDDDDDDGDDGWWW